ncbi:MAG: Rho termination factor N-terminal domain-containing protein [Chitinispirillaceae bacterium]|nr:Rho termination factor N-terminal domain-containing protein [Chitinispirillaceae bacterium]
MVEMTEIKKKAREMGISGSKMKKNELILAIQKAEGNYPCFKTASRTCDQSNCLWRDDCLSQN